VRFGLIGTGYWADVAHAAGIAAHPQAELVGVWGRDAAKAEALAERHGARPFDDLDALLEAVDAVAFSVPPDVQGELAPRAAEAGKALLLEKPLALDVAAAERIVEAARVPTVVLFTFRLDPTLAAWYRAEVDGHAWDGAAMLYLGSIFEEGNPFGASPWRRERGALWDVGPHALAALLPSLGAVEQVTAVRGRGDEVHLALRHASRRGEQRRAQPDRAERGDRGRVLGPRGLRPPARLCGRRRDGGLRRRDRRAAGGGDPVRRALRPRGDPRAGAGGSEPQRYMTHLELQPQSLCLRPHLAHSQ
jgi:predicted dehydrogenase